MLYIYIHTQANQYGFMRDDKTSYLMFSWQVEF